MILVVGSTGFLGSEICRRLAASGKSVRGLVRSTSAPEKVALLKDLGVETVTGDLRNPPSLAAACQGVEAVITTASTTFSKQPGDSILVTDQQGQLDLVQAARHAGVRKFVYVSIPQWMEPCPLTTAKRKVEQAIISSGMDYTILCPCFLMEIWLSPALGFDYVNAKATIYGHGHAENAFISLEDVAEYAVQSIDNPAAHNAMFELGQTQSFSLLEVVRIFEQAGGKPFELQFVPILALETQKNTVTDPLQISCAAMLHNLATGIQVDPNQALLVFPEIQLKTLTEYASTVYAMAYPR